MPSYDFKCKICDKIIEDQILRITHTPDQIPVCCDQPMGYRITQPPLVHWHDPVIEPFRNPAAKRGDKDEIIQTTRQRKEFMAKNDLVDANDIKPPSHEEQKEVQKEVARSIAAISPDDKARSGMEKQGLLSIVD